MSIEQIQCFIQRFENMFNQCNMALIDELFAPNFVAHVPIAPRLTRSSCKALFLSLYNSFPDIKMQIDDSITTEDQIVLRVTYYGTHLGAFLGIPATGCWITMPAILIFKTHDNLAVENWSEVDILGVIRQISDTPPLTLVDIQTYAN